MNNEMIKLPADCARMTEAEMMDVEGGSAVETAVKAVVAIGGAVVLTGVAAVAAKGILSIFNPNNYSGIIEGAVDAGQSFLNKLLGK